MKTILITNDPAIAADAQAAGVSRIMVDLEWMGKKERQASRITFLSTHGPEDISRVRDILTTSELIVRINPWNAASPQELELTLHAGADIVMLPMIQRMEDFDAFITALAGRAQPMPLVETVYSMNHIEQIAAQPAVHEIHLGLNDLHLDLGLDFLFEPLALGHVDRMVESIRKHGKRFGFGGIAMMGSGDLPAERILAEHARLGSSQVILSSRFCKDIDITNPQGRIDRLKNALARMQQTYDRLAARTPEQQQADTRETNALTLQIAASLRQQRAANHP